jgi:anti-sigma28 factor (negative regulator of flagellin synthesis)
MKINPHISDVDPTLRKRQVERARDDHTPESTKQSAKGEAAAGAFGIQQQEVTRYVAMLKDMDPVDLHRVEDIRQRIENGAYSTEMDELIDPLLDFLGDTSA